MYSLYNIDSHHANIQWACIKNDIPYTIGLSCPCYG